jgi:hypothetical protein
MKFKILDDQGNTTNTINASLEFVQENYPGRFEEVIETPPTPYVSKRLSKLEFLRLLTDLEYESILSLAKTQVSIEAWLKKFEMATSEPDGTSIDLNDPRTIAGIHGMCAAGIFNTIRRDQILAGIQP